MSSNISSSKNVNGIALFRAATHWQPEIALEEIALHGKQPGSYRSLAATCITILLFRLDGAGGVIGSNQSGLEGGCVSGAQEQAQSRVDLGLP
jgi:hypothetical protein